MGQKTNPIGFRLGITEEWRSRWYAGKKTFGDMLIADQRLRKFIKKNFNYAAIKQIDIERSGDDSKVVIHAARPGQLIGRKGAELERIRESIKLRTGQVVDVDVREVNKPELAAQLVAESCAEQIARRIAHRRVMKKTLQSTMQMGAKGIRIRMAGRLGGREMKSVLMQHEGSIPLSTLNKHVDYGFAIAQTTYGSIGVKVWIYNEKGADGQDDQTSGRGVRRFQVKEPTHANS